MPTASHPYVSYCGGSPSNLHDLSVDVPRPEHLHYNSENARYCEQPWGGRVYFELMGQGATKILLLMGLGATHCTWEPQLLHFGDFDDFQVCVPDSRGLGFSDDGPKGRWRTTDLARDAMNLLQHLEAEEGASWASEVHLVGFSLGGMIALELYLLKPERFASLCLISSSRGGWRMWPFPHPRLCPPLTAGGVPRFLGTFASSQSVRGLDLGLELLYPESFMDCMEHGQEVASEDVSPRRLAAAKSMIQHGRKFLEAGVQPVRPQGVIGQTLAAMTHYVSRSRLQRSFGGIPVLIIAGMRDRIVDPSNAIDLVQSIPGSSLHMFESAGHGLIYQYSEETNELIERHIRNASHHKVSCYGHPKGDDASLRRMLVASLGALALYLTLSWRQQRWNL